VLNEQASVSFWTAIAALAGVGQVVVLIVTARFVWRYLNETQMMRKAAENQVEKSQSLVALGLRQLEGQIKPALVARVDSGSFAVTLVNVGSGPALHLMLSAVAKGSVPQWDGRAAALATDPRGYLEARQERLSGVRTRPVQGLDGVPILGERGLLCEYSSLSGQVYATIVDFGANGVTVERTELYERPDMP
jgi:hypothetical protein